MAEGGEVRSGQRLGGAASGTLDTLHIHDTDEALWRLDSCSLQDGRTQHLSSGGLWYEAITALMRILNHTPPQGGYQVLTQIGEQKMVQINGTWYLERKCVVCVDNIYAWNVLCVFVLTNIFCMPHHVPSICFAFDDPPDQHYNYTLFRFKSDILQRGH